MDENNSNKNDVKQEETTENGLIYRSPSSSSVRFAPKIGSLYSVRRLDGQYFPAEILEKRELKGKSIEYFVHFENRN
jgi:hypothetical protein